MSWRISDCNTPRQQDVGHAVDALVEFAVGAAPIALPQEEALRPQARPLPTPFTDVHRQDACIDSIRFMTTAAKVPPEDMPLTRP
jgi:hypothetical protein